MGPMRIYTPCNYEYKSRQEPEIRKNFGIMKKAKRQDELKQEREKLKEKDDYKIFRQRKHI